MSTTITTTIIPALGLRKLTDSGLNTYAMERIESYILYGVQFPGLKPTQPQLATAQTDYSKALGKLGSGGKSATIAKNNQRTNLEKILSQIAENAAEFADGDSELYALLGFGMKSKGTATAQLPAPTNFSVKNGPSSGSIECRFKYVKNAHAYEVYVIDETGKIVATATNSSTPVITFDVAPLKQYKVKCRAIGAKNKKGTWTSDIMINVI
ncbi:MAG: hypothetical protein ABIT08_16540 [Bacteroidia bacterium]